MSVLVYRYRKTYLSPSLSFTISRSVTFRFSLFDITSCGMADTDESTIVLLLTLFIVGSVHIEDNNPFHVSSLLLYALENYMFRWGIERD